MRVAIIAPTNLLRRYCTTDYHLALAHLLDDPKYLAFYKSRIDLGQYVILDNSVIELGRPVGPQRLFEACERLNPSELVLCDYPRDPVGTLFWAEKYASDFKERFPEMKLMAVPQWHEFGEVGQWMHSYEELAEVPEVDVLGIPKFLKHYRLAIVHWLNRSRATDKEHHLLGTWGDPREVISFTNYDWIRGVDTKAPVRFGRHGIVLHALRGLEMPDEVRELLPQMDFDDPSDPFPLVGIHNMNTFIGWANHKELANVIYLDKPEQGTLRSV